MLRARFHLAASLAALATVAACGGHAAPAPSTVPLPPDPAPTPVEPVATKPAEPAKPPAPARPLPPLDVPVAALASTSTLVSAGKGKKSPLVYSHKAGAKQTVQYALDFVTGAKTTDGKSETTLLPTLLLTGELETTAVAPDGGATYKLTIATAVGRDTPGARITAAELDSTLGPTLPGAVMTGMVGKTGVAGAGSLHVEKPDAATASALEFVRLTLPTWPVLPTEPVGEGAKWRVTTPTVTQDRIAITLTTDYELLKRAGTTWSVKGTTTITGADQDFPEGKISAIGGTGTLEATEVAGILLPTTTQSLETSFTASQGGDSLVLTFKSGTVAGPK